LYPKSKFLILLHIFIAVKFREELLTECVEHLPSSPRSLQVAITASLRHFVERLRLLDASIVQEIKDGEEMEMEGELALATLLTLLIRALAYALGVSKHPKLRKEALGVLFLLAKRLKGNIFIELQL
jgi:proteasome component ECM29